MKTGNCTIHHGESWRLALATAISTLASLLWHVEFCACAFLELEIPQKSVYDLLPKELQLPPSRETSVASMSQTSGGEAGSPPPAVVAAGFASEAGSVCIKNDL